MDPSTPRRGLALFGVTAIVTLVLCQAGSALVHRAMPLHETRVITSVLHVTHLRNTGGVFGMFQGHVAVFAILSGAIIAGAVAYMLRERHWAAYQYVCFGLIVGAAASNVCDRLVYGAVIDFIDIQGIPHWDYVFNPADVAIHLGAWPLALGTFFHRADS